MAVGLAGVAAVAGLVAAGAAREVSDVTLGRFSAPSPSELSPTRAPVERLAAAPLSDALRQRGYHECNPADPIGLGPYSAYQNLALGRIAIPQRGGHTPDMGYDVVVHFHGHSPVRKTLVQVARGVAYVGIDLGLGSGPYADAFQVPGRFPALRRSVERALQKHSNDERAHIRHLALSAWSAGYGAVNEILKHGDEGVDAVVLLDGLHAGWNPAHKRDGSVEALSDAFVRPTFEFARRALRGEKIFVFTHSEVDPVKYPSTQRTADLLLSELELEASSVAGGGRFGMTRRVDVSGLHVWGYEGGNELAHCRHIALMADALYLLESAWDTPPLDRSVPATPAPRLGGRPPATVEGVELELVAPDAGAEAPPPVAEVELLPNPETPEPASRPEAPKAPSVAEQLGVAASIGAAP